MPTVTIEGPPIEVEQKRKLVRGMYDVAVAVYGIEHITVVIKENAPENVGVRGELLVDRKKKTSGG